MIIGLPNSKTGDKQHARKPGYEEASFMVKTIYEMTTSFCQKLILKLTKI